MSKVDIQRDLDLARQELKITKRRQQQQNDTFEAEIRELKTANASLSLTLQETQSERDELTSKQEPLLEELAAAQSAHKAVKREVETLSTRYAEMRDQNRQLALEVSTAAMVR